MNRTILTILCFLVLSGSILADIHVPDDFNSIQAAINASNHGDTIIVSPGRYYENINFTGKAITLTSLDPNDPCTIAETIIDGSTPADVNIGSCVTFNSGEGPNSILTGFTITKGTGSWLTTSWEFKGKRWNRCGGGVLCHNMSQPVITKNVFEWNIADQGAGVYIYGNPVNPNAPSNPPIHLTPEITHNTFINNDANTNLGYTPPNNDYPFEEHGDGGAIVCFQGVDANIHGNTINDNHAYYYGGGMHIRQWSHGSITNNIVTNNKSSTGAGIHITYRSSPLVKNNSIKHNQSGGGGGIYVYFNSHPAIEQNIICENSSSTSGGIGAYWDSKPLIKNNLILRNDGAAIYFVSGSAGSIIFNTIANNSTAWYSAAIHNKGSGIPLLENNIITSNTLGYGIRLDNPDTAIIRHNNIWNNELGNYNEIATDQNGINGNISDNPYFVGNEDYRIGYLSPCRDTGDTNSATANDFADNPRPHFAAPDIGAYELQIYDLTATGTVDYSDLSLLTNFWLEDGNSLPTDLDDSNFVDFLDFSLLSNDWQK